MVMKILIDKSWLRIFILALLTSWYVPVSAQEFRIGFEAGPNLSLARITYKPKTVADTEYSKVLLSAHVNGYFACKGKGFMGISVRPGLSVKGSSYKSLSADANDRLNLFYLNLPLMADFYLTRKLEFSIGPEPAVLLLTSARMDGHPGVILSDMYETFELSGIAGFCYRINERLSAGLRYSHAFSWSSEMAFYDINGEFIGHFYEYNHTLMFSLRCAW